jgi:hypothetical protein
MMTITAMTMMRRMMTTAATHPNSVPLLDSLALVAGELEPWMAVVAGVGGSVDDFEHCSTVMLAIKFLFHRHPGCPVIFTL